MIQVRLLTEEQAIALRGNQFRPDQYFNPIQDADDNWIIGQVEVVKCVNPKFIWVNELPVIDYKEKPEPEIF